MLRKLIELTNINTNTKLLIQIQISNATKKVSNASNASNCNVTLKCLNDTQQDNKKKKD